MNSPGSLTRILESRTQYRPCHVRVPDLNQRLTAIYVDGSYYSLLKLVKDRQQALEITSRLAYRGEAAIITATAKGDAIWVLERDAYPDTTTPQSPPQPAVSPASASSPMAQVLESRTQYRPCHIRVPDLEHRLPAISFEGQYYSLFKVVKNRQQAQDIAAKLARRGDRTIITSTAKGEVVWVLEPEAEPESATS